MSQEKYQLYFEDFEIGMVESVASDFPNIWGIVQYAKWLSAPRTSQEARIAAFIELNQKSIHFEEIEDEQDVTEDIERINQELKAYQDFIETEAWYLIDRNGDKSMILCPIFRDDSEIVWRWNQDER
jgi:hypothetical protein